ncbi:amidohydrolase family protein [Prauserella muralis]|uniref:Amidohydrolase n=1 Tax=Prauserella muralis TaxID=588067 RepID=A0A2V4B2M1_9PSEU|nr:amidohydrolase family protein [Prauserella muralis]PXY27385.1 amidohydrolase [Prauserella muralis]TWE22925.1 imidazolonepropionase-like amidohydrolase [Prauserella muralis]
MTTVTPALTTERRRLTVLRPSRLFDGVSSTLIEDPVVVVDGSTIVAVDHAARFPVAEHTDVVDLPGATLLPGLIDTHVHLCFDAGPDVVAALAERDDAAVLIAMARAARVALAAGVTTLRDLGDRDYLALALREAGHPGPLPTIVAAGPPITTPGGHCHFLGGAASGVDGVRAAVREHAERGVDVIKVMASGGHLTPGSQAHRPQFSPAELRSIVEQAHRFSLPVTAHAHSVGAIADAVAAGVDGLEHASFQGEAGVVPAPEDLVAAIAERRVDVGATLGFAGNDASRVPPPLRAALPLLRENLRRLIDAGAPVVLGTDAGIAPPKPHDVLPFAVVQLTEHGPTPAQALRTVTSRAASVLGLAHRKGRVAPGYDADLLAVDGDPLTDLSTVHRVRAVYARGAAVPALSNSDER